MKRIGIDIRMIGSGNGGIGRYIFELTTRILNLDAQNYYYLFFNKANTDEKILENFKNNTRITLIPSPSRHYSFSEQTAFLKLLNKHKLDLVHFPNFNLPILYNRPYVVTIHDMVHHKISGAKKSHWLHFLAYKQVIARAAKKARAIITVSEASKSDIVEYLKILPRKIEVIYEASSLNTNVSEEEVEKVKNKFIISRPYFLFVGVLERKKNIINLTRGFSEFLSNHKLNMDLVIAGKVDKHYPEIKHKALDVPNKDKIVFTDYVEEKDLSALYKGAFAFVSSSLHEGFGLPGVEAMAFGLPLAVSNIKVFNEVYDNAAIYFNALEPQDIAQKLFLLANDKQYYRSLSDKSLQRSELFKWETTAKKTLEIYKQITL